MTDKSAEVREGRDLGAFIPSILDDYGLSADEFRIYAHIARRAGNSSCWEGMEAIAARCKMNVKTARKAIAVLKEAGLIKVVLRPGQTSEIWLTKSSDWRSPNDLDQIRGTTKKGSTQNGTPTKSGSTYLGRTPLPNQVGGATYLGRTPLPNQVDKGTPLKEIPLRYSPEGEEKEKVLNTRSRSKSEKDEPGTCARSQKFEPEPELKPELKYPTSIQNFESSYQAIAPWKASRRRCDYNPAFIQHILGYLKKLPSAEKRTPDLTDAKGWIVRRESTEQGLGEIQIQWDAFIESGAEKKVEAAAVDFNTWDVSDPRHKELFYWFRTEGWRMDSRGDLPARYRQWLANHDHIEDQLLEIYPEVAA